MFSPGIISITSALLEVLFIINADPLCNDHSPSAGDIAYKFILFIIIMLSFPALQVFIIVSKTEFPPSIFNVLFLALTLQ